MDKDKSIRRLSRISNAYGAPGFEGAVAQVLEEESKAFGKATRDKMGNLYLGRHENKRPLDDMEALPPFALSKRPLRVQLDAHMDEVGFMVQHIRDNGCLEMLPLGGWLTSNIPAHRMQVMCKSGDYITGLTTSTPPHFLSPEKAQAALQMEDIVLDLGCSSKHEVEALGIEVGAPIVPDVDFTYNKDRDLCIGKAFDCRSGCAAIVDTLERLHGQDLEVDVFAAFACQEEVGVRGATVTAQRVKPDLGIVFEGCPADDTFGEAYRQQTKLGKGPMLRHLDARMVTHPGFQKLALDLASAYHIPVQRAVRKGGATNASAIHLGLHAAPCIVIGIPVRYIHTAYGMACYHDHKAAVDLAVRILEHLNAEVYEAL